MDKPVECLYCERNELQKSLMIEICDLSVSTVFLFKEQSHPGRCIVAYKEHAQELFELTQENRNAYMNDICKVANAIQKVYQPAKINYGAYSDKLPHLHFHLVPKYIDAFEFGGVFEMNPQKTYLNDEDYANKINNLRNAINDESNSPKSN